MRRTARVLLLSSFLLPLAGCSGYRLVRPSELEVPSYEPRPVAVPPECGALIDRAAVQGVRGFEEGEARMLQFCQHQQLIRAQEEEAAAKRLEAHAEVANFALRATVTAVGAVIAVLAWVF